jgi:hypothetical protein
MAIAIQEQGGIPDMKVSIRQVFGIDSDMEVPAFSEPDEHVPNLTRIIGSIVPPRWPSWRASPRTGA